MKAMPPVQKNDVLELPIHGLTADGRGVGRMGGYAVFVQGALPGEVVRCHVIKANRGYGVAKLLQVLTSSPHRQEPACPAYARCGGCALQHMTYAAQLEAKRAQVQDALQRLGGFDGLAVEPVLGMETPWHYRNKGSFPAGTGPEGVAIGFFAPHSHRLVPLEDCRIQDPRVMGAALAIRDWARQWDVPAYDEATGQGTLRHAMARASEAGVLAVVVTAGPLPHQDALVDLLRQRVPGLIGVVHNRNDADSNVILGPAYVTLWGEARLPVSICGLDFSVSAASFLQVNPVQTQRLYETALSMLNLQGKETVLDVYCGIGTISLLLARHAKKVIGIESVQPAVEDAARNAEVNGIQNAQFLCGLAETLLPQLVQQGLRPDAMVIDPPRKGCDPAALQAILASGVPRLIYISCDPATLARDCKILAQGGLYPQQVQPVDMFPHTGHVETVVLLGRELEKSREHVYLDYEPSKEIDLPGGATYEQIKAYVLEHTGLKVSHLYIAQVKQKHGILERECYNKPKSENAKQPKCPPEKEAAIEAALKHFKMI